MLALLVGNVDINSAFVLVALVAGLCIVTTSLIVKRRSRIDIEHEFYLAKMRQQESDKREMLRTETEREYKFKQLDQNLITSHRDTTHS